jgi:hypothetical protein
LGGKNCWEGRKPFQSVIHQTETPSFGNYNVKLEGTFKCLHSLNIADGFIVSKMRKFTN